MGKVIELKPRESKPVGMQNRIPAGHSELGSDGLFEALVGHLEASPGRLASHCDHQQHVIRINERLQVRADIKCTSIVPENPFRVKDLDRT